MIDRRWVHGVIDRVRQRKLLAQPGSTTAEMGLMGALVLVATIGCWFFLGNGLQQMFTLVKKDMLTQVSHSNGLTLEQLERKYTSSPASPGYPADADPVSDGSTVSTAGSNGQQDHPGTYEALQALIDRLTRSGKLTEAQVDTLSLLTDQILLIIDLEDAIFSSEIEADYSEDELAQMEVQFRGQTYLLSDLAARLGMQLTVWEDFSYFDYAYYEDDEAPPSEPEWEALDALYTQAEDKGLFDDPEVADFIDSLWWGEAP